MTTDKLDRVFRFYLSYVTDGGVVPCKSENDPCHFGHLAYMATAAVHELIPAGKVEKAMRWLGFIQGVLVCRGVFKLEDVKRHSMPEDEEYRS